MKIPICRFCALDACVDTYIRDDKRRWQLSCQNWKCLLRVVGHEFDSLEDAILEWTFGESAVEWRIEQAEEGLTVAYMAGYERGRDQMLKAVELLKKAQKENRDLRLMQELIQSSHQRLSELIGQLQWKEEQFSRKEVCGKMTELWDSMQVEMEKLGINILVVKRGELEEEDPEKRDSSLRSE